MREPRPRDTKQFLAALQNALITVARPNPLVLSWQWRYELAIGFGLPSLLIALIGIRGMLDALPAMAVLIGVAMVWSPSRHYLADRGRADTCSADFASALPLLVAACWASGSRPFPCRHRGHRCPEAVR